MRKINTMALFIIGLIFSFESFSLSRSKESAQLGRWEKLNMLISKEERAIKSLGRLGPKLQYRLLELKSEKIKLLKEKENEKFILSKGKKRKKEWYFKKSNRLFREVNKMGHKIIRSHPKFNRISRIYYTLALNERDYGNDKRTEHYLHLALKSAKRRDKIVHNTKTSLAEYYYNSKKYHLAVQYYNDVIKNKKDDWYTKHLFNQAWCLLKIKKLDQAISNLKLAFKYSKNPRYISISDQVLQAFVVFFVHGNQVNEGIHFYTENVKDPTDYLIAMAKRTAQKGLLNESEASLKAALKKAKQLKKTKQLIKIRLSELEIYRNFKKLELYFQTAKKLEKLSSLYSLEEEDREDAVEKIKSLVLYLQIKISKNLKLNNLKYDKKELLRITDYFKILSSIDKENDDLYLFHAGETYYSVSKFQQAAKSYSQSISSSLKKMERFEGTEKTKEKTKVKKRAPSKLQKKVFDSMLALLGSTTFDQKGKYKFTKFTYEKHIQIWPVSKRSKKIYNRLFNLYIEQKNIQRSLLTFNNYKKNYPLEKIHQQAMITRVMDFYIISKNTEELSSWITKIQKGFLSFNKSYLEKSISILSKLLFEKYQRIDFSGNKDVAAKGYESIFFEEKYPKKIKAQSALNAAIIYLELTDTHESYKWAIRSLKNYHISDKKKVLSKFLTISKEFALLQDFKRSSLIASFILKDFCNIDFKEKLGFYNISVYHQLIENNFLGAEANFKLGNKCHMKNKDILKNGKNILQFLAEHRRYKDFFSFYRKTKKTKAKDLLFDDFISAMIGIYWDTQISNRPSLGRKIKKLLLKKSTQKEMDQPQLDMMNNIQKFERFVKFSNNVKFNIQGNNKKFNEKIFNKSLMSNLESLQRYSLRGEELISKGHKELILGTYILLNKKYLELSGKISAIVPRSMPTEFVIGFKKSMKDLLVNLKKKSNLYNKNARKVIHDNDILSYQNFNFLEQYSFINKINYRYPASKLVSTADTEGTLE